MICLTAMPLIRNLLTLVGRPIKIEISESKGKRKPSIKIFIGNVADGTTDDDIRQLFADQDIEVLEADVINGKNYAFVHVDASSGKGRIHQIIKVPVTTYMYVRRTCVGLSLFYADRFCDTNCWTFEIGRSFFIAYKKCQTEYRMRETKLYFFWGESRCMVLASNK